MQVRAIYPTARFKRSFRRLPIEVQEKAIEREQLFRLDPFDPRLETHKLRGRLKRLWPHSVDFRYRVLFRFAADHTVIYYDIGDHAVYR